jgi:predicted membrane-bound spermidine synthase
LISCKKSVKTILECFLETFVLILIIPLFCFIAGLCAVGGPIIIAIPTVVGIIVGMATGILYSQYALQGLGYSALIIMPATAIVIGTLLKCCNESINMSLEIIYLMLGGSKGTTKTNQFKEYCLRYLVLCVPFLLSAVLNTVCFKLFGGLFSFV